MLINYFKSALRFFQHNKVFVGINLTCLSLGMAASFIILIFVINELRYNHFNTKIRRVFRVIDYNANIKKTISGTPFILAKSLKENFPQIEHVTTMVNVRDFTIKINGEFTKVPDVVAADSEVFKIFTLPLIAGTSDNSFLDAQNSIVLSRSLADKIFPGQNPIGQEISAKAKDEENVFTVSGVFEDIPKNSTLRAQCLISNKWAIGYFKKALGFIDINEGWSSTFWNTWILLSKNCRPESIQNQLKAFEVKYLGGKSNFHYSLQNLGDVYLGSDNILDNGIKGNKNRIRLFSTIAFLIILVATINYILLSTAISTGRGLEIGIRKTFGAGKGNIKIQLLGESLLLALMVLPIAFIIMSIALPYTGKIFQTKLDIFSSNIFFYIITSLALTIIVGFISGFYTSHYLARLKVMDVFGNTFSSGKRRQIFRSFIIVIEVAIFCSFVSASFIIRSQYKYLVTKDLGHYNKNILVLDLGRNFKNNSALINNIRSIPNLLSVSGVMYGLPLDGTLTIIRHNFQDKSMEVQTKGLFVDYDFLKTMGISLFEGREFSPDYGSDLEHSIIINETAVKRLDITDPIGKKLGDETIIGVVKDFNIFSLYSDIPPLEISLTSDKYIFQVLIHYAPGTLNNILPLIKTEWKKVASDIPFSFTMIEDLIKNQYNSEKNLSIVISLFAFIALLISAFGLFGLTLFVGRSRIKEIGVRKAFGGSENSIVYSFLLDNIILVITAALLSIPGTLYFVIKWLNSFAFRTNINSLTFVISFTIAAIIVLSVVYINSYQASHINPVEALRHE